MKLRNISFLLLVTFVIPISGRRKYNYTQRVCTRLDAQYVHDLIPSTVEEVDSFARNIKEQSQKLYDQLISIDAENRTFQNTVRVYDTLYLKLWMGKQITAALSHLHKGGGMRLAASGAARILFDFEKQLYMSGRIDEALEAYQQNGFDRLYRKAEVQDYLHMALQQHRMFEREDDGVDRLLNQFLSNTSPVAHSLTVDDDQLSGLSKEYRANLQSVGSGRSQIPVDYHSFFEVMETAESEDLRKAFYHEFGQRGYPENIDLIQEIVGKEMLVHEAKGMNHLCNIQ